MRQNPASETSETYMLKVQTLENGKPEELLQTMKDFNTGIDGTGTTSATEKIQFIRTMLRREALTEFDVIRGKVVITNNTNINE